MAVARDIMSTDLGAVSETAFLGVLDTLSDALSVRHVPVIDGSGRPVGIVSIRDILQHHKQAGMQQNVGSPVPVREVMSTPAVSAPPDASIKEIARLMVTNNISSILIVEHELLVGIVTERDFLKLY